MAKDYHMMQRLNAILVLVGLVTNRVILVTHRGEAHQRLAIVEW